MKQLIVEAPSSETSEIRLSAKHYTYLVRVLRKQVGDSLVVRFADGRQGECRIRKIDSDKRYVVLEGLGGNRDWWEPKNTMLPSANSIVKLVLLQWLLKGSKMDTIVRQATEMGVSAILPVRGEFSVVPSISSAKENRYARIVTEARQQSGSPISTQVFQDCDLENALLVLEKLIKEIGPCEISARSVSDGECSSAKSVPAINGELAAGRAHAVKRIVFSERSEHSSPLHKTLCGGASVVVVAIGAEGGISENEYALLARAGFQTCHLQTNVLRAETASLYALAATQTIVQENNTWQLKESN